VLQKKFTLLLHTHFTLELFTVGEGYKKYEYTGELNHHVYWGQAILMNFPKRTSREYDASSLSG
jgi:hypothetical protein